MLECKDIIFIILCLACFIGIFTEFNRKYDD